MDSSVSFDQTFSFPFFVPPKCFWEFLSFVFWKNMSLPDPVSPKANLLRISIVDVSSSYWRLLSLGLECLSVVDKCHCSFCTRQHAPAVKYALVKRWFKYFCSNKLSPVVAPEDSHFDPALIKPMGQACLYSALLIRYIQTTSTRWPAPEITFTYVLSSSL